MDELRWADPREIPSQRFVCGHCGTDVSSSKGLLARDSATEQKAGFVAICHCCTRPTFLYEAGNEQVPAVMLGNDVRGVEETVQAIYDEARKATGAGAYTAAVLCCRKLLMHIAVEKGADPDLKVFEFVQYLLDKHYITADAAEWVDHIRDRGNEANHQIVIMDEDDAEELISFCEMLLRVIYEYPARMRAKKSGA